MSFVKCWWGLDKQLNEKLSDYPSDHYMIRNYKRRHAINEFIELEEKHRKIEERYGEMETFLGVRNIGLLYMHRGFTRCILHVLVNFAHPLCIVYVLILMDNTLEQLRLLMVIESVRVLVQLVSALQ